MHVHVEGMMWKDVCRYQLCISDQCDRYFVVRVLGHLSIRGDRTGLCSIVSQPVGASIAKPMEKLFQRHDLISCEALVKGNLCTATSHQNYNPCKITFAQFTNKESKQRIFCLLLLETEVICIINPLLDVNPKPYDPKLVHKFKPNQLVISKGDGKYCAIKCSEKAHFNRLQTLLCDALAEAICCDSMKPLQSGRLSATRLTRCLNTCKLLTRDVALVQQVSRLKSIRKQINNTMQTINNNQCAIPSPEVRKVRAGCNFIQRIYPTFRCDPDLQFLTEQLRGGKHSAEDLEIICRLLLQVEHEDKTEFMRMVRASSSVTPTASKENIAPESVVMQTNTNKKQPPQPVLLSPSKRIALHKKVSWDSSIGSNEKNVRQSRKTGRQTTPTVNSPRRPIGVKLQPEVLPVEVKKSTLHSGVTDILNITTPTKSQALEVILTATPVPPAVLHARVVSPSKRTLIEKSKQKAQIVPNLNLLVLIGVMIVGMCCVYCSWPQYSALTFSTPHGVTTVSISVSSAAPSIGSYPYESISVIQPILKELSLNETNGVRDAGLIGASPDNGAGEAGKKFGKQDNSMKNGALIINVAYTDKVKLSPLKGTFNALSKIVLSPIKFVKSLFRNAMRLFGHIKGAKRISA